jgi:hypothetical protein
MARKVVNRKALREEAEAAEKAGLTPTKKKTAKKKKAARGETRSRTVVEVRKKVFWGVFNQSLKRVATFEFDEKKQAEKKAQALSQSGKSPHFVQKVTETIDE